MSKPHKPQIGFVRGVFEKDERPISLHDAMELFNSGGGDWSNGAYRQMIEELAARRES